MKILTRHLFLNLFKPMIYLLLAFTMLFVIADLMNNASEWIAKSVPMKVIFQYYTLKLPSMIIFIVPICLLLATLYSLSMLTRHSEIVAMRASGVSIYRIIRSYLFMGILCSLVTFFINEFWGAQRAYSADKLNESHINPEDGDAYTDALFLENPGKLTSWQIESFDTRTYTMNNVVFRTFRLDGSDLKKITAKKGYWLDDEWWLQDGTIEEFDENSIRLPKELEFDTWQLNVSETPQDLINELKPVEYRSSLELRHYIKTHKFLKPETLNKYRVDFHHRLTMPFICLIAVLIGIPVGAHTGRKGALAGIMLAIGMFFGLYALQFTMEYLAKQMLIAPWIGAWSSIIVFTIIGSVMIHRMR
ncbi:MAG: LptF/LptG family permease [Pontiellaceae bacterium]|nr:LptF/LptG family permease [Pontiellaceae bacterium]